MNSYNFNKYNFKPGDIVILDETHPNHSNVKIVSITPRGMFSRVHSANIENPTEKDMWETMTNRLTPIK